MQLCVITGTITDAEGAALQGVDVYAKQVIKNGELISSTQILLDTSDEDGEVEFSLPRASTAYLIANVVGLDDSEGVALAIPDAPTATLESLVPATFPISANGFNFLALGDTPDAYTGFGGRVVGVKSDVSGLEFVDVATDAEVTSAVGAEATTRAAADTALQTALNLKPTILRAYKTADESLANSDVLQTDDHLTVTLVTGRRYDFKIRLQVAASADGLKLGLGGTATFTHFVGQMWAVSVEDAAIATTGQITEADATRTIPDGDYFVTIDGSVECNVGGTFVLRWAQETSNAEAVIVKRGSTLVVIDMT